MHGSCYGAVGSSLKRAAKNEYRAGDLRRGSKAEVAVERCYRATARGSDLVDPARGKITAYDKKRKAYEYESGQLSH